MIPFADIAENIAVQSLPPSLGAGRGAAQKLVAERRHILACDIQHMSAAPSSKSPIKS
jgi:hypothetical protein